MCNKTETHLHNILYNDERDGKGQSEGGRKYNRNVWFNSSHTQRFKKKCKKITATTTAKPYLRIRRKGSCSTFQKPVVWVSMEAKSWHVSRSVESLVGWLVVSAFRKFTRKSENAFYNTFTMAMRRQQLLTHFSCKPPHAQEKLIMRQFWFENIFVVLKLCDETSGSIFNFFFFKEVTFHRPNYQKNKFAECVFGI